MLLKQNKGSARLFLSQTQNKGNMNLEERLSQLEKAVLTASAVQKEILTFDEACIYMGMARSCLYKLTHSKKIIYHKPNGKMIYFKRADLDTYMLQNRIATADEIEMQANAYVFSNKSRKSKRAN